jgi:hypothetical protein
MPWYLTSNKDKRGNEKIKAVVTKKIMSHNVVKKEQHCGSFDSYFCFVEPIKFRFVFLFRRAYQVSIRIFVSSSLSSFDSHQLLKKHRPGANLKKSVLHRLSNETYTVILFTTLQKNTTLNNRENIINIIDLFISNDNAVLKNL